MASARARVLRVLALVAFVVGLLLLGAHMSIEALLLQDELTFMIYGIAGGGAVGALAAFGEQADGRRRMSRFALAGFALNAVLVAATFVSTTVAVALPPVTFAMDVGETLPEFEAEPRDPDGRAVRLADLRGKPVVLLFHRGGWCPFCQAELSRLSDRRDEIEPLATVLAISVDVPEAVRAYARSRDLGLTLLHDEDARVTSQYGLTYDNPRHGNVPVPAAIVLDSEGRIAWFHVAQDVRDRTQPDELLRVLRMLQ
jgi:peroxiredoxin